MPLIALTEGTSFLMLGPMLEAMSGPIPLPHSFLAITGLPSVSVPLGLLLIVFVGLVVGRTLLQQIQGVASVRLQNEMVDGLRLRCFSALMRAEWRLLSQRRLSDFSSLIITNIDRVGYGVSQIITLTAMTVTAAAGIGVAFILSWQLSLFALACGIGVILAFRAQRRRAAMIGKEENAAFDAVYSEIQEAVAGIRVAKVFRQESRHIAQVRGVFASLRQHQLAFVKSASLGRAALNVGGACLLALTIYLGLTVWHVPIHRILPLVLLFSRFIPLMSGLQQSWENVLYAAPALSETSAMLEEFAAHSEPDAIQGLAALPLAQAITIAHVGVTYADRAQPALEDVTLTIPARTTTVIMGQSGAGKSTLADVLMGLVVPDQGMIAVDGVPLSGVERMRWREGVGYVQQDAFLFNASIRANLLWAKPDAGASEIYDALGAASASFVFELPDGLDTIVGDGGVRLSGGERQRIVLARALLRRPSLLILDEATSALDPENELAIRHALAALHGELTVIIIGHRIALADTADQLIKMEGGRAVVVSKGMAAT